MESNWEILTAGALLISNPIAGLIGKLGNCLKWKGSPQLLPNAFEKSNPIGKF